MHNIKIWDRVEKLKGLEPNVWLNAYPQTATKTLVLVDDTSVYFLEDIKEQGITGNSDMEIVENYLKKLEEEISNIPDEPEIPKSQDEIIQELKRENETLKNRVDTLSSTVEELVLTTLE